MEEDIKVLEEDLKQLCKSGKRIKIADMNKIYAICQLIENLLTRYKQLEERVIYLTSLLCINDSDEDFIPKSKIKEKIEELKEIADEDNLDEFIKIRALQEILE